MKCLHVHKIFSFQKGVIHGMLLGVDNYLKNNRQGDESLIVNISSVVGVKGYGYMPIYCGTKFAINGKSFIWRTCKCRLISNAKGVFRNVQLWKTGITWNCV